MLKPFQLYRKSQEAQLAWIRNHVWLWIALNAIATIVFIGYIEWRDRREMLKWELERQAAKTT